MDEEMKTTRRRSGSHQRTRSSNGIQRSIHEFFFQKYYYSPLIRLFSINCYKVLYVHPQCKSSFWADSTGLGTHNTRFISEINDKQVVMTSAHGKRMGANSFACITTT
jgi:hypothetical protein